MLDDTLAYLYNDIEVCGIIFEVVDERVERVSKILSREFDSVEFRLRLLQPRLRYETSTLTRKQRASSTTPYSHGDETITNAQMTQEPADRHQRTGRTWTQCPQTSTARLTIDTTFTLVLTFIKPEPLTDFTLHPINSSA